MSSKKRESKFLLLIFSSLKRNQLQPKLEEASKVLLGMFSKREGISINIEDQEMGPIEEQQLEAKSEERNSGSGLYRKDSIGEDTSTHSKEEIGLKETQQDLDQLRSGLLQQQKSFQGASQAFHQMQMLNPQHQQQLMLAQQNLTSPSASDVDSRRLRMLLNNRNLAMGNIDRISNSVAGGDVIPNLGSPMQASLPRGDPDMKLKFKMAPLQQQQQQQQNSNNNQQQQLQHQHSLSGQQSQSSNHSLQQDKIVGAVSLPGDGSMSNSFRANYDQGEIIPFTSNTSPTTDEVGDACELVKSINGELDNVHPSSSSELCIYRVPQQIRELNEKAYDPRVISIGPFHHGRVRFKSMEAFKMRYLKKVVQRSGVGLEKYVEFLKNREASVRQCYSEIIEMGSSEFVRMLLLDGCFIIELLLCAHYSNIGDVDYSILTSTNFLIDIRYDLILLENQIPFFVLEGLYNLAKTSVQPQRLLDLAISYFDDLNTQKISFDGNSSIKHFTDMILIFHRPVSPWIATHKGFETITTATELAEAGVEFKMGSSTCLLDIKFTSDAVLEIPHIVLDDDKESLFRNMMALEVCHHRGYSYMIDYLVFIDGLVNTPKDVDLLIHNGILHNCLGDSKKVADLFNNMNINITFSASNFYFSSLCRELKDYCKKPTHKWRLWRAILKRDYFSSPWSTTATLAAFALLVLTFIQTVCSLGQCH